MAALSAATGVEMPVAEDLNMNRHAIRNTALTTYYDSQDQFTAPAGCTKHCADTGRESC